MEGFEPPLCEELDPKSSASASSATWASTDRVRFELTIPLGMPVFKTGAFNRSATYPSHILSITFYRFFVKSQIIREDL